MSNLNFSIGDGTGNVGQAAKVDGNNRLHTLAITQGVDRGENLKNSCWSYEFTVTPAGSNDYFFYLKNDEKTNLIVTDVRFSSTSATDIDYDYVTGTPVYVTGTNITPTSRKLGGTNTPTATCKYDTDITGLTKQGTLFFSPVPSAEVGKLQHLRTTSGIILPKSTAMAIKRTAAGGEIRCIVSVYSETL